MDNIIGKQIGSGGTSNVYEWGNEEVIKIYKPHVTDDVINHELYIGQVLNKVSFNIPKLIGETFINGKKALIYERVIGNVMGEALLKGDYESVLAHKFAEIHYSIHKKSIDELPSQYEFLKNRIINLRIMLEDKTTPLLNLLDSIPIKNVLCHGDFQPLNIMGNFNKYVVIDWNGACLGNPILDVAWSFMTLNSPIIKNLFGDLISETLVKFTNDYLIYYCKMSGVKENQIMECLPIVAARRLYDNNLNNNDHSKQEKEWLLDLIYR